MQETFRAAEKEGERGACTAIYFLLAEGQKSHWHKVDAVETWLWHSGGWACTKAVYHHQSLTGRDTQVRRWSCRSQRTLRR